MKEKIILGFGNNVDYEIVWDSAVIEDLIHQYAIRSDELTIQQVIESERDLVISILGFLQIASGGERFVASTEVVEQFSQRFARKITVGGTSIRAAIAMRKLGYTSALHLVTLNDHVRRLIPPDSPFICSSSQDSSYPHLIVQFGKDTRIQAGDIVIRTQQANRLIYHSDTDNIVMELNEDFADLMTEAKVLLVSGFNAMHDQKLLTNRLESVLRMMEKLPKDALVFCEDAGFYEPRFSHIVYGTLAHRMHILSLNEDELQGYLQKQINLLDVNEVAAALAELHTLFPVPIIVVHTKHWALAYGDTATSYAKALKAAVTMATTRFCYGDDFTIEQYRTVEALPPSPDNAAFVEQLNSLPGKLLWAVPVAQVEPAKATTVGLGDAFVGGFLPALL